LRGDLELLPEIAEAGLAIAAKDISQGGVVGTSIMLAECSGVGIDIDVAAIPVPHGVALERWLLTFPSFGYLLSVMPANVDAVIRRFRARGINAANIGSVHAGNEIAITDGTVRAVIRDYARTPLMRFSSSKQQKDDAA